MPQIRKHVAVLVDQDTTERRANGTRAQLFLERAARMGHEESMRKFLEPLAKSKRWEAQLRSCAAAAPWW